MKICPKCAAENTDTAKFCNECGTALEIKKTESVETTLIPDTQFEPAELKEDVNPSPEAEATTDNQNLVDDHNENTGAQISNSEISQPEKKKTIKLKIWQKVLIAIVAVLAILIFRPRITKVSIGYKGDTTAGTVLDDNNPGFYATGTTNYGKQVEIPYTDLRIKEPKTLEADSSETVTVYFKNASVDLTIDCTTTALKSLSAQYNGSTYEGTTINKQSDIAVTATYGDGHTQDIPDWYLKPESVILKKGEESKVEIYADFEDGTTMSTVLSITATEKPFTKPEIEGDHYNFSAEQLVAYLESDLGYGFSKDRQTKIGDSYFYQVETMNNTEVQPFSIEIRENANEKVNYVAFTSDDIMEGLETSIILARAFGGTMKSVEKNDMTFQMFMISKMHVSDDTLIECIEHSEGKGYSFYVMPDDYSEAFWKELYNK